MQKRGVLIAALVLLLLPMVTGAAYITYRASRAHGLLRRASAIRIGENSQTAFEKLAAYADEVAHDRSDCSDGCWTSFTFSNQPLSRFGLRPAHLFVNVLEKNGRVEQLYVAYSITYPAPYEGAYGATIAKVPASACDVPFKLFRRTGSGKLPSWRVVTTPDSSREDTEAAFDLNLRCLATRWGCMAPKDLLSTRIERMPNTGGSVDELCIGDIP